MSTKGNITLFISSLAAGAVLGLLLAPSSGRETRRNLARRGEEMRGKLGDLYNEGTQYFNRSRDQFAEMADRVRDKASKSAENVKDSVEDTANKAARTASSTARQASTANGGTRS